MNTGAVQEAMFLAPYNTDGKYYRSFYNISELQYYTEFDSIKAEDGTYDLSKLDFQYILLSLEEWREAVTGNYSVVDGKHTYTPYVPTAQEVSGQKLAMLDAEYKPKFSELANALGMATLADNSALIASIKTDYAVLKTEYDTKRGELDG